MKCENTDFLKVYSSKDLFLSHTHKMPLSHLTSHIHTHPLSYELFATFTASANTSAGEKSKLGNGYGDGEGDGGGKRIFASMVSLNGRI